MLTKLKLLALFPFFFLVAASYFNGKPCQTKAATKDSEQVRAAILDYVEGVYNADTARIHKSVHPTLAKRGTWYDENNKKYSSFQEMNFQQLVDLTKTWNKDGKRANSSSPREITIYDVQDKTASAKVVAAWGTDYFHLAKIDSKWYIMNVLWQTPSRA